METYEAFQNDSFMESGVMVKLLHGVSTKDYAAAILQAEERMNRIRGAIGIKMLVKEMEKLIGSENYNVDKKLASSKC